MLSIVGRVQNRIRHEIREAALRRDFSKFRSPHMRKVARTHFWRPEESRSIHGWLTDNERRILYALGRWMPGPILEIGSWAGLSTTAIARGIKDSGEQKHFDTVDLNPALSDFRPYADGIGFFPSGTSVPFGVTTHDAYAAMKPALEYPGGVVGLLRRNLSDLELHQFVKVHVGDFREFPDRQYSIVFCDSLHDIAEIKEHAPHLLRFLTRASILACHDVGRDPECIALMKQLMPLGHHACVDSLFVTELK